MIEPAPHHFYTADLGSLGLIVATIGGWLPHAVILLPAIFYSIQIYESRTVQRLLKKWFPKKP